jgi:hypothetical protein
MRHLLLGLVLVAFPAGSPASAQATAQAARRVVLPDSATNAREARQAQREFETARRAQLPLDIDNSRGPCDASIGRFCYWYRPAEPPPEPDGIGRARMLLLARLDEAAARWPGDEWIAGQRVRYLAEQGWADSAVAAARDCRTGSWWCAALEGFALHAARDYQSADSVYAVALAVMPRDERCRWTDLSSLLADADERRYARLSCEEREQLNGRIWWLARPFYSVQGHDLRTEHYARLTVSRMIREASSPHDLSWGDDLLQLVVRYGWPTWWTRPFGRPGAIESPAAIGHEPSPSFWFFADPSVPPDTLDGETWREPAWDPAREGPPGRYAPPYARAFGEIRQAQVARFRRAGGFLTIAAFDLRRDTLFTSAEPKVALALARDPRTPPVVGPALFPRSTGIIAVRSPWPPSVVSLEAKEDAEHRAARLRAVLPGRPGRWLSDVLLFVPEDELPDSLEIALPLAVRGTDVPATGQVGLYWETYGEPAGDSVDVEVKVARAPRRDEAHPALGRAECAPDGKAPVAVRWRDAAARGRKARAVTVDLSALDPGRYVVGVSVSAAADSVAANPQQACASRDLEIRR